MNTKHRRYSIGKLGDPHTTFAFHCHNARTIPRELVQAVWEALVESPQDSIRTLGNTIGEPFGRVELALLFLKAQGFIVFTSRTERARRIPPPKYVVKANYMKEVER